MFIVIDYVVFLLTTTIAFLVFCALWIAFIVGMFVVCRSALRARFSSLTCNFIAFALSSSCLFELLRMHRQRRLMQQMFLENGPPVDCLIGRSFGGLLNSYLNELNVIYRIPAFIIASICVLSFVFALFGYKFSIAYGLIQIDFQGQQTLRLEKKQVEDDSRRQTKFIERKRMESNNVQLVHELYQKRFCSGYA
ncbi:hypothetical protein Tcan_18849 [Toxocara canis]|uniref:Uncharacterized protein n=1 Tax=Toxocara canis TaxID=6265 RepID=A0A0B2VU86_TOXCA|nr:hypothetical protein Tcan_18849 [Toxocara canis]